MSPTPLRDRSRTNNNPLHRRWAPTNKLKRALIVLLAVVALAVPVWLVSAAATHVWRKPRTIAPPSVSHSNTKHSLNAAAVAGTIYVDDSWASATPGTDPDGAGPATNFGVDSFATIQDGVNAAASGDTVFINAGNYTEQVTISKNLTLTGENTATTVLHAPATLSPRIGGHFVLVQVDTSAIVEMSGITVAGPHVAGGCSVGPVFYGIFVVGGANLNLHDAAMTDIRLSPNSLVGCQDGIAVRAGSQVLGQVGTLTVNNVAFTGYQKSAIIVDNTGSSGTITNNTITGLGPQNIGANGIQISRGAGATITGNNITANECSASVCGPNPVTQDDSTGVLVYSTSGILQISNNTISSNDIGIYNNGDNTTISGNTMVANRYDGIFQDAGNSTMTGNTLTGPMNVGVTVVSSTLTIPSPASNSTAMLTGNTIVGATTGLQLVDANNADAFVPQLTAHFNRIVSGTTAIDNANTQTADLENNWWGCNAGPGITGCGAVIGTGADYSPWFKVAAQAVPNSIIPGATSNVSVDLTHNSDNLIPAGTPPDTPVSYGATNGGMTPPTGTITAGAASSQFTSTSANSAVVTVTVDNENINLPITVTAPSFSIDDVTHAEGNPPGTTAYVFTVTKTGATALSSSVQFQTVDGTATVADSDYVSNSGTLNFGPADPTMQITVQINHDFKAESDEAFTVNLFNAVSATISDANGTGTIQNDDNQPSVVYVDDDFTGAIGSDPDGTGPATAIGYDAFKTIQEGINAVASGGTVIVYAGTYAEQLGVNKPVAVLGPNATINPNTGTRSAEARIIPTASNPIDPSFNGPIVVYLQVPGITFKGFTVDGNNPSFTSGTVFNGSDVDAEFGIYGDGAGNLDAIVENNIVQNVGEFGIWLDSFGFGGARNNNSRINTNKVDNILGTFFGQGIRIADDAWLDVTNNFVTRVRSGIVIENYSGNVTTHPASVISGNNITSYRIGIRHNLHYVYSSPGFTIQNNTIQPYVQSPAPPQPVTSYQGVRVESVQQTVNVTLQDNVLTGNKTALQSGGYTRDEGLNVTNASTTSPNIVFNHNDVRDFLRGAFHETPAVPDFECNLFTGNTTGIEIDAAASNGLIAHQNNIFNNGAGMQNNSAATLNGTNNYWGRPTGPTAASNPGGTGDTVSTNVTFSPFLTANASCAPTISYTITASAGSNGAISPSGAVSVNYGESQTFNITPDPHYHIVDVLVDGGSVGAVSSYTFTDVLANHTISASFAITTHTITASAGANGSISPSGAVIVNDGNDQAFTTTPNTGFHVQDVLVDSVSVGPVTSYNFTNVTANHTIAATFALTCGTQNTVYVDDSWVGTTIGTDPDGAGPATSFGCDSFATIQEGINGVAAGGSVIINAGTYNEDVNLNKAGVSLLGAGAGTVSVVGPIGGPGSTIAIAASNVTVAGMTITRAGNNTTDWNNPNLNTAGISIQGLAISNALIRDNVITGNRTGIDINNSNGHTVRNNSIADNRTGMILRNQTDNLTVVENFITNNWTVGVLFLDASGGTNSPVQTAHHSNFNNNDLSGNWYAQIVDRQSGGSLPAPGTSNLKNFKGDWFGTASPVTTTANSAEPGYAAQIPVEFGGSATAPGGQPDIAGPASANFLINPILTVGTDTNVETTPGRGTNGFQGVTINQTIVAEPSNLQGWVDFDDSPGTGTGSGGFIDGPGTAPLGTGSYFLRVDANGRHALGTLAYVGTRMDDITELKYSSYQNNNTNTAAAISLQFDIDYDLTDGNNSYAGRLVFEPYLSNTVQQGVWQNWDAMAGKWWGSRTTVTVGGVSGVAQPCQPATPCTWAQVLSLFPNAGVGNTPARALLFKAGGPVGAGGFDGDVDDFSIKFNTVKQTYDFEPNPHISINDVSHNEGNAGTTSYDFTVSLSRASSSTVTVDYATANSSAVAPGDFTAIGTTQLTFNPGETSKPVAVLVNGDPTNESDEQFFVNLSNQSANADITDNQGVGTIVNDDAPPSFSIDDVTHNEGNSGTTNFTFTVTKTGATELPTSVNFQTVDGTATLADNDYVSNTGTLNFGPSDTSMQITVQVKGDTTVEPNEAFTVHLSAATGATISDADGTGSITNDDRLPPNVVYVDDSWVGTPAGTDPDGAGPATEFGYDAFATIQNGVNGVADPGTVIVFAGNYPENVTVPKSLSLLGPNASIDPNTGTRVAEAVVRPAVTETSVQASTSGTIFRLGTVSGHINVTIKGFTLDGNNPVLTGGRTLNGVEVHTGAGIVNSVGSFDSNPGGFDTTMVVQNNIIQNLERYGVLADNVPARTPAAGTDVSFNKIDNLPSGNNFGGGRGRGIAFEENLYGSATFNVMTRVNVGWQDDNYNLASPGSGTLIDHNQIHTYHRGIFHNLQYQDATAATITNNQIFAETTGDFSASATNFGVELASIQSAVGATVTNNSSTGNVYGILIWNVPTTNTITVSGGTLAGNQDGVLATMTDPQFGAGAAGHVVISGVTVSGATTAGMVADGAGASMQVTGSTISSSAKGVVIQNGSTGNTITGNSIHANTGLGIDLGDDGVTANDTSDADSGPNNLQNFPIIGSALVAPNSVSGTLNSAPNQTFTIHLYANPACDPSGNGEGQTLVGATTANTNGSGDAVWTVNPGSLNAGDFITATATDSAGNTSEFSACFQSRAFAPGTITFGQVSSSETNSDHDVNVIVSRTGGSDGAVSVQYNVTDGTATLADNDYSVVAPSGTLTWANGDATDRSITIRIKGDLKFEADETVLLTLSNPTGGASTGGTNPALTITNDDTAPSFSIDDVTHNEGNAGTTAYVFTITRTGSTALNAVVNFQTADGSATVAGNDYQSQTGSLTFLPGDTSKTVTVLVNGDTNVEPDETFTVNLSGATNATISDNQGLGTIVNDDTNVSVAVSPASVLEDGATNLVYTFTRNGVTSGALTVNFSVSGGATFGTDYTQSGAASFSATNGTVTFAAGSSTATVTIDPTADTTVEPDETVVLTLAAGTGYNVAAPSVATGTITNDDADVSVAVSPSAVLEDGATNLVYTFTRSGNTTGALTVNFAVAGNATFNSDYTQSGAASFSATNGTVTFAAGSSTATVTIDPTADNVAEPNETVILTVSTGSGYNVGSPNSATGTITNDDTDVSVAVSPLSAAEDGPANLVYTFTRNGVTTGALTVNFSVGGTATFNSDYTQSGAATFSATNGTVAFAAGSSSATVTIDPTVDTTDEPDETVILTVASGSGYGVGSPSAASGTILNDDGILAPGVSILQFSSATYNTTESSFFTTITVQRLGDSTNAVSVDYATPDDSAATSVVPCSTVTGVASPRCDFTAADGTLHWAAGDTAPKTFIVLISQDNYVEGPEQLTLTLSNPSGNAQLGSPATAVLTIADDATEPAQNPIDDPSDFVRQPYHDFLNREPDQSGFDFWVGNFPPCNGDPQCIEVKRINVSGAFYLSIEFQGTGYLVERLYKTAYGDATGTSTDGGPHQLAVPIVKFSEFEPDDQEIGRGVVVGATGWEAALEAKKVAFVDQFVLRSRFLNAYPSSMTPAQFVDALNANAGNPLSTAERNQLVSDLTGGVKTRAQVLRAVAEDQDLVNAEFNRAFVLMQYFGYLRRNPDAAPDSDHSGYDFWLKKLNSFNGNFQNAEMVKAFLSSIEYRRRSGAN